MRGMVISTGRDGARLISKCIVAVVAIAALAAPASADDAMEAKIRDVVPALDAYVRQGMQDFDNPGLAIGIVTGDKLVFAKGYGVRRKGGEPVDSSTVFQIGSTTKAFLATTMAIAADRGKLAWDARVVDLDDDFQMKDPWVTGEFRVFDLISQRSGMPPAANDAMGMLGLDQASMVRAMRYVEPVSSFRSTFAYTNVTHMLAQRIVARSLGASDWDSVVRAEIFEPLGMTSSSFTADAIEAAPNHAEGYRWAPDGTVEVPFTPIFPYDFGAAGAINSSVEDLAPWLRLHLANGTFEGKELVSAANLAVTKVPRTGINETFAYAMGWLIQSTPNGRIVWHNGGTTAFGAYVGTVPDKDLGIVVLTNETNVGLPDAIGEWALDRLMGNPEVDHVKAKLEAAKAAAASADQSAPAADRQPATVLPPLAGDYLNPAFGKATVSLEGSELVAELKGTGARLKLSDLGGQVFSVGIIPEGRFAAIAANVGPSPIGVIQFKADGSGAADGFDLVVSNGQHFAFERE